MTAKHKMQRDEELVKRAIELAENDYNCSQILMKLALDKEGKENPDLIRSMYGLGDGCGFMNETCGILAGTACLLSWYATEKTGSEIPSDAILPMLQELKDSFEEAIEGKYTSTRCKDIVGDLAGSPEKKFICGPLLLQTYGRTREILQSYGFK